MTTPSVHIRVRRYVSGRYEAALHNGCKGSYADAADCCQRRRQAGQEAGAAADPVRPSKEADARPGA
jgi:hypothetical protein